MDDIGYSWEWNWCVCVWGGLEGFWESDEESAIGDGGGRREWFVTRPRVGERWPGIVSLKTASLENDIFP